MKFSSKHFFVCIATCVLLLATFEFVTNKFSIEEVFSIYYSVPILLFLCALQRTIKENRLDIITIVLYLAILFFTIVSIIHIFMVSLGFGFTKTSISTTHFITIIINISMMILSILQFTKHTKQRKSIV